jgi:hypothetical protein
LPEKNQRRDCGRQWPANRELALDGIDLKIVSVVETDENVTMAHAD